MRPMCRYSGLFCMALFLKLKYWHKLFNESTRTENAFTQAGDIELDNGCVVPQNWGVHGPSCCATGLRMVPTRVKTEVAVS